MPENRESREDGANRVAGVDGDRTKPRRLAGTTPTPFTGRPIIYGVLGYIVLVAVCFFAIGLLESGIGLWPLVVVVVVVIVGSRWLRRL